MNWKDLDENSICRFYNILKIHSTEEEEKKTLNNIFWWNYNEKYLNSSIKWKFNEIEKKPQVFNEIFGVRQIVDDNPFGCGLKRKIGVLRNLLDCWKGIKYYWQTNCLDINVASYLILMVEHGKWWCIVIGYGCCCWS